MKKYVFFIQILLIVLLQQLPAQTKSDTIHVSHYDINLEIRDFSQQQIRGYTDLALEAKIANLQKIYLHFLQLTVDSVKNGDVSVPFSHQGQQLQIDIPFLTVGQSEKVRVYYSGKPYKESFGGFYFTNEFAYNMGVGISSIPPSLGRAWFPCIDEFTDKSTYTFNITTDADKKAICGGMLVDSTDFGDAICWKWELSDPIPSYLASVAVGKYLVYKDTIQGVSEVLPVEIYADSARMARVPGSFVNLKFFIHTYEKRWGPCRWQRIGYVVVPFSSGAMEHATNIAYPQFAVNGNTTYESLVSHELAHSWFGNLITCATAKNMWINEGFARYGEYLCDEILDPTLQSYQTGIRALHMEVLKKAHSGDGGYFALNNIPPNATYGSTTYDKGGLVAYTLRHYMGDDLYFSSIKQFLQENQYKNVDSEEFFQKLSEISETNLHDFYLGWVNQPGFLNFNIDSIKPKTGSENIYQIAFKQRLHHAEYFADNNKVDVEFVAETGERYLKERIQFSGEHDIVELELPFEPVFWAIDPNFKMGDACYDYTLLINKTGNTNLGDAFFRIEVTEISEESVLRVEHNPFTPTPAINNTPHIVKISEKHFWRIGFLKHGDINASYSFSYDRNSDSDLLPDYTKDDLALLHRKDASYEWRIVQTTIAGTNQSGRIITSNLQPGEYTLGVIDNAKVIEYENSIEIYPNPVADELRIRNCEFQIDDIKIFDVLGKEIIQNSKFKTQNSLDVTHLSPGTYILEIISKENKLYKKFIKL